MEGEIVGIGHGNVVVPEVDLDDSPASVPVLDSAWAEEEHSDSAI